VKERISIIGERFQVCNRHQDILRSIEKAGLNLSRPQIHFEDPILKWNDRILSRMKVVNAGGFVAGLQNIAVSAEILNGDDREAGSNVASEESPCVSSATTSSSSLFTSVSEQLAKAPEPLDSILAFMKTRSREELEEKAREVEESISAMSSSIEEQKGRCLKTIMRLNLMSMLSWPRRSRLSEMRWSNSIATSLERKRMPLRKREELLLWNKRRSSKKRVESRSISREELRIFMRKA